MRVLVGVGGCGCGCGCGCDGAAKTTRLTLHLRVCARDIVPQNKI